MEEFTSAPKFVRCFHTVHQTWLYNLAGAGKPIHCKIHFNALNIAKYCMEQNEEDL
jgi:hypothetical protein